jgi:hypothetical protein
MKDVYLRFITMVLDTQHCSTDQQSFVSHICSQPGGEEDTSARQSHTKVALNNRVNNQGPQEAGFTVSGRWVFVLWFPEEGMISLLE